MTATKQAASGVFFIGLRQGAIQALGAAAGIILARLLSPGDFGLFAVSNFLFYFFQSFGDLGFGAAMVRQAEEPSLYDLRRIFTVRQSVSLAVLLLVWVLAPEIASAYGTGDGTPFRIIALSSFVMSFSVVPTVLLERRMRFGRLALLEVSQTAVFAVTVVWLSWAGWSLLGYSVAWMCYAAVGSILANVLVQWRFGWSFSAKWVRSHLAFALPYQGLGFASLARDAFVPLYIGIFLGTAAAGHANWAQMSALFVAHAIPVVHRVFFPVFANLHKDRDEQLKVCGHMLLLTNALAAAGAGALFAFIEPITIIVFGAKWLFAVPLFYTLWPVNLFIPSVVVLSALLNARGQSGASLKIAMGGACIIWILGPPLILFCGIHAYGIVQSFAALSLLYYSWRMLHASRPALLPNIVPCWVAALATALIGIYLQRFFAITTPLGLAAALLVYLAAYSAVMAIYLSRARRST